MHARRIVVLVSIAAVAAVACAAPTPSEDELGGPIEATTVQEGVSLVLAVDRALVAPGGDVTVGVLVGNAGPGPVTWQGGGCDLQGDITVTPVEPLPVPPGGPVVGDGKAAIRQLAIADAYAIRWPSPPEFAHGDINWGCTAELRFNTLEAAEETRASVVWVASTVAGSPAPPGDYIVEVTFPYVGRGLANPPMEFQHERDVKPIRTRLLITVEEGPPLPSPDEAMDAILAAPAFGAGLERHPRRVWDSTMMRWTGGAWVVQVRYRPGGLLEGRLDPASGTVVVRDGLEGVLQGKPSGQGDLDQRAGRDHAVDVGPAPVRGDERHDLATLRLRVDDSRGRR
jgi:hypothetical protein